jgi:DNA-directed RNA polymerase beta' subunit
VLFKLLDVNAYTRKLNPITSTIFVTKDDKFHEEGLFSEIIFGKERSKERKEIFAYIDLHCSVIHPSAYDIFKKLDKKIEDYLSCKKFFRIDEKGNIEESDDTGLTGLSEFIKNFSKIKLRGGTEQRNALIDSINKSYKSGILFITRIPVIPPDLRPITKDPGSGDWEHDPINDFYVDIMRKSYSIKSVGGLADTLSANMNYWVQDSVNKLDKYVKGKIAKKTGLIRNQMLGKRTDFSGRAVIVNGPNLGVNEMGVPVRMAATLFEPFIIHQFLYTKNYESYRDVLESESKRLTGMDLSVDTIKKMINFIMNAHTIPDDLYAVFKKVCTDIASNRLILSKRDPCLHPEAVRAYRPIIIDGGVMELSNFHTSGHGADFDGDTMAIFHPLTNEAQKDAKKLLTLQDTAKTNGASIAFDKDTNVGIYILTKDYPMTKPPITVSNDDLKNILDVSTPVIYRGRKTTAGRAIFNSLLPDKTVFIDRVINKKAIAEILTKLNNNFGYDVTVNFANQLQKLAYKFITISGYSLTLDDLLPDAKAEKMIQDSPDNLTVEQTMDLLVKAKDITKKNLVNTPIEDFVNSGAARGWEQIHQTITSKGLVSDVNGNILPLIKSSFSKGLSPIEYFNVSYGSIKGITDRVLNTADTGYIARQLAYLLNSVELDYLKKDCGTQRTLKLKLSDDIKKRLSGRFVVDKGKIHEFDPSVYSSGDLIDLRSPIYCKSLKLCHTCYGRFLEKHKSPYVGILAAQTIGERGTQLIMRAFHTGGAAVLSKRNIITDLEENNYHMDKAKLSTYFKQQENNLLAVKDLEISISLDDYTLNDNLVIDEDESKVWAKSLMCKCKSDDGEFDMILDYTVTFNILDDILANKEENSVVLRFKAGEIVLDCPLEKKEVKESVLYLMRLIGGREIFRSTSDLLMKVYRIYRGDSDMDLVHLETLISQILRDKDRPILPARVRGNPDEAILANVKKNIFSSGILQSLAFENIGEAVRQGLTSQYELPESVLERVFMGNLVTDPNKKEEK